MITIDMYACIWTWHRRYLPSAWETGRLGVVYGGKQDRLPRQFFRWPFGLDQYWSEGTCSLAIATEVAFVFPQCISKERSTQTPTFVRLSRISGTSSMPHLQALCRGEGVFLLKAGWSFKVFNFWHLGQYVQLWYQQQNCRSRTSSIWMMDSAGESARSCWPFKVCRLISLVSSRSSCLSDFLAGRDVAG